MDLNSKNGFALAFTLYIVTVLMILSSAFVLRTANERRLAAKEIDLAKSFYLAEAGSEIGLERLNTLINDYLDNTINAANPVLISRDASTAYTSRDGLGFLVDYVKNNNAAVLTQNGAQAEYVLNSSLGSGSYQYKIVLTEKSDPVLVNANAWDFAYNYRVESTGNTGSLDKDVLLSGDFTVRVERESFAKFALFTNQHRMENGTPVWFTNKTNFEGPVHTNDRLNFALNPSGTFNGAAAQQEQRARFYNRGWARLLDADSNPPFDVPSFNAGYTRRSDQIVLPSAVQKQDLQNQAAGGQAVIGRGIFVPNNGTQVTGGIFARGDVSVQMSVDGNGSAVYSLTDAGGTTKRITVDRNSSQTIVSQAGSPDVTYQGLPDGVDHVGTIIYVDGQVSSLSGTVERDTEVTISSERDIVISNHIRYQNYTAGSGTPGTSTYSAPSAQDAANLLGVLSWGGDVRIAAAAPDNLDIHGVVLARSGVFTVDNYADRRRGGRGTVTLLGGVITNFYGAFGLFSGSSGQQISGYGRNFVFDSRTIQGKSPPYFPTLRTFVASTDDITDKMVWQETDF